MLRRGAEGGHQGRSHTLLARRADVRRNAVVQACKTGRVQKRDGEQGTLEARRGGHSLALRKPRPAEARAGWAAIQCCRAAAKALQQRRLDGAVGLRLVLQLTCWAALGASAHLFGCAW